MNTVWFDRLGGFASATCAVHCLVLALAPTIISVLGLSVLSHEGFEWAFYGLTVAFAVVAAVTGYRVHRSAWVLGAFGVGIAVLTAGRFGEMFELHEVGVGLAVCGGLLLVGGHFMSLVQTRRSREARSA